MDHFERVEKTMRAMEREPDRVFHEVYLVYTLYGCSAIVGWDERRGELLDAVAMACTTILCPPVAIGSEGDDFYCFIQQNPERSIQAVADAVGASLGGWPGDYSCVAVGSEDVDDVVRAINVGSLKTLLASWQR